MPIIDVFDNTMLSTFRLCPRKFFFRMVHHLVPKDERNFVPAFGIAGHEALATWFKGGDEPAAIKSFVDSWLPFEGQDPSGKRCMLRGTTLISQYIKNYPRETEAVSFPNPDMVEVGFTASLGRYLYCGRMDGIAQWTMGVEGLVVVEHKFSSSKGFLCINPNAQLDGYIWGAEQITGEKVIGALFDQIYHVNKTISSNEFIRELTARSDEDIEWWKLDTIEWMDAVNLCAERSIWPRNTASCGAFMRECEYIRLCRGGSLSEQDSIMETLFESKKWNPYPDARGMEEEKKRSDING